MARPKAKATAADKAKDTTDKSGDVAKNIWLAGLGAYGKVYDEAVSRYEKASKDTPKLFRDLVKKGEQLEAETRERVSERGLNRARADIEERLQAVRENLGFGNLFGGHHADIKRVEEKLDVLTRKVDALARAIKDKPAPKSTPRAKAKSRS
jgi:hypothetical protein